MGEWWHLKRMQGGNGTGLGPLCWECAGWRRSNWDDGWVKDLQFDKGVGHERHSLWLWILGPICQWGKVLEAGGWLDNKVNAWVLQPVNNWFPVLFWLGMPWFVS
jgi:hypothetical protein